MIDWVIRGALVSYLLARALIGGFAFLSVDAANPERSLERMFSSRNRVWRELRPGWSLTGLIGLILCGLGYWLEPNAGYILVGLALDAVARRVSTDPRRLDERTYQHGTRAMAAASDAVLVGTLGLAVVVRPPLDPFGTLAAAFALREVLLVVLERWLESQPGVGSRERKA